MLITAFMKIIGTLFNRIFYYIERLRCKALIQSFADIGGNCHLEGLGSFSCKNIFLGDNVFIGEGSYFLSSEANIVVGNNVMFGPHVMIATGNHRTDIIGKNMIDVYEKKEDDDKDVIIKDDVWIGMGVIILKGVIIGKGSIVGAGSIVTKDIPPYSIYVGSSSKKLRKRFTDKEIEEHEKILN